MLSPIDIERFEKTQSQIAQLRQEMGILSKSKPDNPVNKFKLSLINEKLREANEMLIGKFKPFADFDVFDEDRLPSNSDVVFILAQYLDSLEGWRSANVIKDGYNWVWNTEERKIQTSPPTRFFESEDTSKPKSRGAR